MLAVSAASPTEESIRMTESERPERGPDDGAGSDQGGSESPISDEASYDRAAVEQKWRERWRDGSGKRRAAPDSPTDPPTPSTEDSAAESGDSDSKPKSSRDRRRQDRKARRRNFYCLDMFPYPSLEGLSVNQLRGMVITDVVARYQEARGRNVLRPMGWDSFGISIEQEAEREKTSPQDIVERGTAKMRGQLEEFGARVDWDREVQTTDPKFYRWTQWLFDQMRQREVAYRDVVSMKWCDHCRMNLANEEVAEGRCLHCSNAIEERRIPQWKVGITQYAERLHQGLRHLKWPQRVKSMQRHWIGRVEGYQLILKVSSEFEYEFGECDVFVRQLELLPAATYLVLAPEHPLVEQFCDQLYRSDVADYRGRVTRLTERERLAAEGAPEGFPTGAFALNPVTLQPMPIWVSKMVLPEVRFGAVLGVPGHNDRHGEFAARFNLPSLSIFSKRRVPKRSSDPNGAEVEETVMINCGPLSGISAQEARRRIRTRLEARGSIEPHTLFHLRDWIFARQRFWGEPIPMVHCGKCGDVPVDPEKLPVEVPLLDRIPSAPVEEPVRTVAVEEVEPSPFAAAREVTDDLGETWDIFGHEAVATATIEPADEPIASPLASVTEFVETTCPRCGGEAARETDTMPQWAASCWYYLRYLDPTNEDEIFDPKRVQDWLPVDLCVGGIEHAILHLLYVRFFAYFVHDLGLTTREEPFRRLFNQGRIYRKAPPRRRKDTGAHRGDRIPAEQYLAKFGGDAVRLHLMFLGPPASDVVWSDRGLRGTRRFLERAYEVVVDRKERGLFVSRKVLVEKHRLIRRVTTAIRTFKLNKAVSAFMTFIKTLNQPPLTPEEVDLATLKTFTVLLAPFAPHLAAELWEKLGGDGTVFDEPWPEYSEELLKPVEPVIAVQINDRVRDRFRIEGEPSKSELITLALARDRIRELIGERKPDRVVVVPGRLVNFVFADPDSA